MNVLIGILFLLGIVFVEKTWLLWRTLGLILLVAVVWSVLTH